LRGQPNISRPPPAAGPVFPVQVGASAGRPGPVAFGDQAGDLVEAARPGTPAGSLKVERAVSHARIILAPIAQKTHHTRALIAIHAASHSSQGREMISAI
jgi:hypothetical protein